MKKRKSKPISARGWALVLAAVILVDSVDELIQAATFTRVSALVADLVLIGWMLFAFYGKRSTEEREG